MFKKSHFTNSSNFTNLEIYPKKRQTEHSFKPFPMSQSREYEHPMKSLTGDCERQRRMLHRLFPREIHQPTNSDARLARNSYFS